MCKLSFETCVCFLFLVIVAFLSCSGFRIDKLAMTDVSKKNYFTSSSLETRPDEFLASLLFTDNSSAKLRFQRTPYETPAAADDNYVNNNYEKRPHRIRHAGKRRLHKPPVSFSENHRTPPTGKIDAIVFPPRDCPNDDETHRTEEVSSLSTLSEKFAQIPSSRLTLPNPTIAIINRPQRSPHKHKSQKNKGGGHCQEQDIGRKAYRANTVVLAKAESMSSKREKNSNYSVTFRILKQYKSKENLDDTIRLTFSYDKPQTCETDINENSLVKINIRQSKEYFLFLKTDGMHNYSVLGMPQVLTRKTSKKSQKSPEEVVKKVCHKKFVPRLHSPSLINKTPHNKRVIKLTCIVKGFPLPVITWRLNGTKLRPDVRNRRMSITYKRKQSTLRIKSPYHNDTGTFQCVTRGVDGKETDKTLEINQLSNSENLHGPPCNETYRDVYCHNGGTCFISSYELGEMSCMCPEQYTGTRCREKTSMYHERTYTCKLGLSTTYYC